VARAKDHQPLTVFGNVGARRERVACSNA
jgi:hypothetical protein